MSSTETIESFLKRNNKQPAFGQFNVFETGAFCNKPMSYSRRDFYKISLIRCKSKVYYADKGIDVDQPALLFSNPMVPYAWEALEPVQAGYFCIFTEDFIKAGSRNENLTESPLYKIGAYPVFFLTDEQVIFIESIYKKMFEEISNDYIYKYDLLRNYVNIIIHEALKMQPNTNYFKHHNASERIATLFIELLDRQFPVDSPKAALKLKTANDFAVNLSVHVNHLNSSVRKITGKTTTAHISDKIINEAKALLLNTDWSVSEIAYSLGFEYPTYFNNFFKKQTGYTPLSVRK
ncbi:response regulator transcription factor [soil metagenome]